MAVDTSREAVNRVVDILTLMANNSDFGRKPDKSQPYRQGAALILALLSERDTFKSHAEMYHKAWGEAVDEGKVLRSERDAERAAKEKAEAERDAVRRSAKTLAACKDAQISGLQKPRQIDERMLRDHESLMERDAAMTDALLMAEAERDQARAENARLQARIEAATQVFTDFIRERQSEAQAGTGEYQRGYDDCIADHAGAARAWLEEKVW